MAEAEKSAKETGEAGRVLYPLALCAAALAAYAGALFAPFVLDDRANILDNPTIRHLWPLPWQGPYGHVTAGRPVANLSFALSYALSGLSPWGHHALNILVHAAAMLLLYAVVRRAFQSEPLAERFGRNARALAFFSALLWGVHPLGTQAVTYISQRFESLAALFMLAALFFAQKSWEDTRGKWGWRAASAAALFLGMGSKETAVAAPFLIFLYEAVLVRQSFRAALARSWPLYLFYLPPLAWLGRVAGMGGTAVTIDFSRFTPWEYLVTQARVICHYLRLAVFPHPLVMDYGWPGESLASAWPCALFLGALLAAVIWGLARKKPAALAGAFFFGLLSISSSVFPLMDAAFEYRMYLPLAPLCVLAVAAGFRLAAGRGVRPLAFAAGVAAAWLLLGTVARNHDYRSEVALWADTVKKRPENVRALFNLGFALAEAGDCGRARVFYERVLAATPGAWDAWYNLGNCMMALGDPAEAAACYQKSLAAKPVNAAAHYNRAQALRLLGRKDEAQRQLRLALADDPGHEAARKGLGAMLGNGGREGLTGAGK